MTLVGIEAVHRAAERLHGHALRTPLVPASWADPARPLWLKPESLQRIGAFKIRGAFNAVAGLTPQERARGVVTHSSGNHAQAVAYAAAAHGVRAVVVMPDVSPAVKVQATRDLGAEVVLVPAGERESRTEELVAEQGYAVVPPFDHADVIAGQATVGLEIAADLPDLAAVLVPVGGGGLIAGVALAVKERCPNARVIGVEPELAADLAESFRRGERISWSLEQTYRTVADGIRSPCVGALPWEHIRAYVDDVVTVSEDDIRDAMRVLATRSRLVAEPTGAVATAGYLRHAAALPEGPVAAVISGGNVEPEVLAGVLAG